MLSPGKNNPLRKRTLLIGLTGIIVVGLGVALFSTRNGPPGGGSIPQLMLLVPHDGATIPFGHRFIWQRSTRSRAYHFFLYELNHSPVWSALVRDTSLTVPSSAGLQRGRTYLWRVEAILPDETTLRSDLHAFTFSE